MSQSLSSSTANTGMGSDNNNNDNRNGNVPVECSILVSLKNCDSVEIVVWVDIPRIRENCNDKWRNTLTYYQFLDDSRFFTHLDSLLTRLAPLNVIHIACNEKIQLNNSNEKKQKKTKQLNDLLQNLQSIINSRTDLMNNTTNTDDTDMDDESSSSNNKKNNAKDELLSQIHLSVPSSASDNGLLESIITQLLLDTKQAKLTYRGDLQLSSSPQLLKGLGFYLYTQGLLQNAIEDSILGTYQIQPGILNSHLLLDRTAATCIHLLPPPNAGIATVVGGRYDNNSLLGILSQPCLTKMGKRKIETWLRQPLINLQHILKRQQTVEILVQNGVHRDLLRDEALRNFSGMDISQLASQVGTYGNDNSNDEGGSNMPLGSTRRALQSLYQLYLLSADKIPRLVSSLNDIVFELNHKRNETMMEEKDNEQEDHTLLHALYNDLTKTSTELERSMELAEAVIDLDQAPREFLVKSSYKEELQEIKNELLSVDAELEDCHNEMNQLWAETTGSDGASNQVRLETSDSNNGSSNNTTWQFRLPNTNDSKVLNNQLGDYVQVHRILKNGVYFTTKQLRELACKKNDLLIEYEKHQRTLVFDAMQVASTYQASLEKLSDIVASLDVFTSLAHVAAYGSSVNGGYCKPQLTDGDEDGLGIELIEARHPCVELQENVHYIPNDIKLTYGESNFLLVTGPNMGGKSTYIRALGAIVTLAQIGSFVPCKYAKINICHHILARVGAGDLQDRGISTFMAEMLESSSILRQATRRSLIIIDELGRGTSTFDGYGLAKAISEYIIEKIGCYTVFTTHFHELAITLQKEFPNNVNNCHVTAQKNSGGGQGNTNTGLTFLYQIQPGPCLESFGIQVAEMANVPSVVIADAKKKAKLLENFDYAVTHNTNNNNNEEEKENEVTKANSFLTRFKNMPLDQLKKYNPEELIQLLNESM